jgi:hypothetical protein
MGFPDLHHNYLPPDEVGLKCGKIHREGLFGMSKSKIHKMANNAF